MKRRHLLAFSLLAVAPFVGSRAAAPKTTVAIDGDKFLIYGKPTYEGRPVTGQNHQPRCFLESTPLVALRRLCLCLPI